jgi:hypothetical protein
MISFTNRSPENVVEDRPSVMCAVEVEVQVQRAVVAKLAIAARRCASRNPRYSSSGMSSR